VLPADRETNVEEWLLVHRNHKITKNIYIQYVTLTKGLCNVRIDPHLSVETGTFGD
jgi:hypothetical protein